MNVTPDGNHAVIQMSEHNFETLKQELDPPKEQPPINKFELRGYEIAKLQRDGSWERVGTYRPNELARSHANAMCRQMNARGTATYQVRGVVSVELPKVEEQPLVLEADNEVGVAEPDPISTPTSDVETDESDFGLAAVDGFHHDIGGEG